MAGVVREVLGEGVLAAMRPSMGGEDFSAYQQRAPGVFAFVGAGNAAVGADHPHHHPRFQVDEASLGQGMAYLLAATHALLADAPVPASA
jgi:amidohydrolase